MKKILLSISSCCIFQINLISQIPQNPLILGPISFSSGMYLKENSNMITSLEEITNDANVTYKAGNNIKLLPGFRVNGLSNQGRFLGKIQPNDFDVVSMSTTGWTVPKYEKLELGLKLPAAIENQINDFFTSNGTSGINPYDPEVMQINFFFTLNGTQYKRRAFYYRDFNVANNNWIEQPTEYMHRVRFAPPQTGNGTFYFEVWINGVLQNPNVYGNTGTFIVTPSNNHGHLTTANTNNTRKFFYEDGTPFFGIGQNLWAHGDNVPPCIDQTYYSCVSPTTYTKLRGMIDDMADNGGNFTRLRIEQMQFPVMWANQQYLQNDPPPDADLSKYLVNYDNNQKHMWELDQTFNKLEERDVHAIISLLQDQEFSIHSPYAPASRNMWAENPYSSILGQGFASCKNFFTNTNAQDIYKKYLDYVIARWGYSTSLGGWMMINETKNVSEEGVGVPNPNYSFYNQPYVNDAQFRNDVDAWVCNMKFFMEQQYPWHPTTTGLTSSYGTGIQNHKLPCLNFWSQNDYALYSDNFQNYKLRDWNRFEQAAEYFNDYKPFIFGEIGMTDGSNEIDKYNDRTFHNSNWISVISGAIGTGMYWNDMEQDGGINHRANFNAIKAFSNNVDWGQVWSPALPVTQQQLITTGDNGREMYTFNAVSADRKNAIAFALNNSSHWANDAPSSYIGNKNYNNLLNEQNLDPTQLTAYDIEPQPLAGNPQVEIKSLLGGSTQVGIVPYIVDKYKTYGAGGLITSFPKFSNLNVMRFPEYLPFSIGPNDYPDYAYIVKPYPVFRTTDTLVFTDKDTVYLDPAFITNKQNYAYHYDWGNGISSNDTSVNVSYPVSGTYTITLTVYDNTADTSASYTQVVKINSINELLHQTQIVVYPNPVTNLCYLQYDIDMFKQPLIEIYDQLGKLVIKETLNNNSSINLTSLKNGMYYLKFSGKDYQKICKLVKQ